MGLLVCTVGGSLSNSFIMVSEALTILTAAPFDTSTWNSLSTSKKEQLLMYAALAMEYLPLRGYTVYENQALCFPRTHQADTTVVPAEVKLAQAYIAHLVIRRGLADLPAPEDGNTGQPVSSVSLGGLLSVGFGNQSVKASGLAQLMMSSEFPIFLQLGRHLATFRFRGDGARPELEPQVD